MGSKSRRKGRNGELEVRDLFEAMGFKVEVTSPLQARRGGIKRPDVRVPFGDVELAIEVKRPKALRSLFYEALEQAREAAAEDPKAVPIVMVRGDRREWLVVMGVDEFMALTE